MDLNFLQGMLQSMRNDNSKTEQNIYRERAQKAYQTRIKKNPNSFKEMSAKASRENRRVL